MHSSVSRHVMAGRGGISGQVLGFVVEMDSWNRRFFDFAGAV